MGKILFTSDTHFNHKNITGPKVSSWKKGYRWFDSIPEMNEQIIEGWNSKVNHGDVVYHLGDVGFASGLALKPLLERLNGNIHLLVGNHEEPAFECKDRFLSIQYYMELTVSKQKLVLMHYPIESWNKANRGSWMLHGHCHNSLGEHPGKRLDVGLDNPVTKFAPMTFEEIQDYMNSKPIYTPDHH